MAKWWDALIRQIRHAGNERAVANAHAAVAGPAEQRMEVDAVAQRVADRDEERRRAAAPPAASAA